jgi:hypothetical protein
MGKGSAPTICLETGIPTLFAERKRVANCMHPFPDEITFVCLGME